MLDVLNLLIGPLLLLLVGLLLVGLFKRVTAKTDEGKRTSTKLMLWGGGGIIVLIIVVAAANALIYQPHATTDFDTLPTPQINTI